MARGKKLEYEYGHEFQEEILHLAIRNGRFLRESRGALKWEYFSAPDHKVIADLVLQYFDKYQRPPSKGVLLEEVRKTLRGNKHLPATAVRGEITRIWQLENVSLEHVSGQVRDFAATQAAKDLIAQFEEYAERGEQDHWFREVDKALSIRHPEPTLVPYEVGMEERFRSYKSGFHKSSPIKTRIAQLDKLLLGGVDPGEMVVVLGLRGKGKSHCLINMGAAAVEQGKTVYHISCEMYVPTIHRRYDQRLTKMKDKEIAATPVELVEAMKKYYGKLFVASYPKNSLSPSGLRNVLNRKGPPDLLIVDYGKLMRSDTRRLARHEEIGDIYAALRDIGQEFNCPVWTAAQVNRQGYSQSASEGDVITQEHLAESIQIADHADIILSLNRTSSEQSANKARIWVDKNREGPDGEMINVMADWSRSLIQGRNN